MLPKPDSLAFDYVGLMFYVDKHSGTFPRLSAERTRWFALFGRVVTGAVHPGDMIVVPATDGTPIVGTVSHFQESFYDWVGLPFYHTVGPSYPDPFCLFVHAEAAVPELRCPGRARQSGAT